MAPELGWEDILAITIKGQADREFLLHKDVMLVGRSSGNDIVLDDPLTSREHARLERQKDGWNIADMNSFNGTYVDGIRIRAPRLLRYGNRIKIGDTMMIFRRRTAERRWKIEMAAEPATLRKQRIALAQRLQELQRELDELVVAVVIDARSELELLWKRLDDYDTLLARSATEQAEKLLADVQTGANELERRLPLLQEQSKQAQRTTAAHEVVDQLLVEVNAGLKEMGRQRTGELRRARNTLRRRLRESQKAYEARDFHRAQVLVAEQMTKKDSDKLRQALVDLQSEQQEPVEEPVRKQATRLASLLDIAREELIALTERDAAISRQSDADDSEHEPSKTDPDKLRLQRLREDLTDRLARLRDPIGTLDIALKVARALTDFTLPEERQAIAAVRSFKQARRLLGKDDVE